MEKKRKIILFFALFFALSFAFLISATDENSVSEKAYTCLNNKIDDKTCSQLSLDEQIFSLLAVGKCKDELLTYSINKTGYKCFGKRNTCNLKQTAQAIIALKSQGFNTSAYSSFFSSEDEKKISTNLDWFLQIDSSEPTNCTITYSENSYPIKIYQNKTLNDSAGNCLDLSDKPYEGYWLEIDSNCLNKEFEISCDKDFSTNLLYKKSGTNENTIHVSEKINSATAGDFTKEKVNSFCLGKNGCDYEGTLWATFALELLGKDISPYMPYLTIFAEDNQKYLPDAFLYYLTADPDFSVSLLEQQDDPGYWLKDTNKYYDTAVALFPFVYEISDEKTNAINWLNSTQGDDGCWDDSIINTAFLLSSIWPEIPPYIPPSYDDCVNDSDCSGTEMCNAIGQCVDCLNDSHCSGDGEQCTNGVCVSSNVPLYCEDEGYNCMPSAKCSKASGEILGEYSCSGFSVCCSAQEVNATCIDIGGTICTDDQTCLGTPHDEISTDSGFCCKGTCETSDDNDDDSDLSECETQYGTCKSSCDNSTEEEKDYECNSYSDVCCFDKESKSFFEKLKGNIVFVIIFIILLLSLLAFVFRKKLEKLFKKKQPTQQGFMQRRPGMFPPRRPIQMRRQVPQKRIIPQQKPVVQQRQQQIKKPVVQQTQQPIPKRVVQPKPKKEDVFKKLKEMSK